MSPHRPRRGSALLVVLVALALVGVLVTSSLHGALAAAQDARIRRAEHRALDLAEWELAAALGGVRGRALATMPEGERRADTSVVPGAADSVVLGTWRLSRNVLWLVADARVRDAAGRAPSARRRVGLLVGRRVVVLPVRAALVHAGELAVGAAARVGGADVPAPPWRCAEGAVSAGAVRADSVLAGELARWLATLLSASRAVDLDVATPPALPAASLVRARGDLVAPPGAWHGVLVVDGDLRLAGGTDLAGLLVVRGRLTVDGVGNHVRGTVLALGAGPHRLDGDVALEPSSCAVAGALDVLAALRPVPGRAWAAVW